MKAADTISMMLRAVGSPFQRAVQTCISHLRIENHPWPRAFGSAVDAFAPATIGQDFGEGKEEKPWFYQPPGYNDARKYGLRSRGAVHITLAATMGRMRRL